MASDSYHEPLESLSEHTRNMHRAIVSLMEELEAIDWYQQRASATPDTALRDVLLHNKNEEIEHAMMVLEWLRRNDPKFDETMRTYLFTEAPITEIEEQVDAKQALAEQGGGRGPTERPNAITDSLGIGALKGG